jgi:hypothetical protein
MAVRRPIFKDYETVEVLLVIVVHVSCQGVRDNSVTLDFRVAYDWLSLLVTVGLYGAVTFERLVVRTVPCAKRYDGRLCCRGELLNCSLLNVLNVTLLSIKWSAINGRLAGSYTTASPYWY